MVRVLLLGGDITCVDKLKKMSFDSLNNESIEYINLSLESNLYDSSLERFNNLLASKKLANRAKLKFTYKISKHYFQSSSFPIQLRTLLFGDYRIKSKETFNYFLRRVFGPQKLLYFLISLLGFLRVSEILLDKILGMRLSQINQFNEILSTIKPNILLVHSSGYDNISFLLKYVKKDLQIKIISVVNNWDNPSSKGFFGKEIDHVALWNHQQLNHVEKISGLNQELLSVIGSVTADKAYLKYGNFSIVPRTEPTPRKLLYIGQQSKYDEVSDVINIAKIIRAGTTSYDKVIYRPHPMSFYKLKQIKSRMENLTGIEINNESEINLSQFEGIITLPTTFLLEILLCKKPAILYIPENKNFRKSPAVMWRYKHFDPLRDENPICIAKSFNEIIKYVTGGLPNQQRFLSDNLNILFPRYNSSYINRVDSLIKNIVKI
jgi:hypothetical protein